MTLNASALPGANFDLDEWKLQLPIDSSGGFTGSYVEVKDLDSYASQYFFTGPDGAMVLRTPVEGATTGGSSYARTELRELDGISQTPTNAAWTLDQGGYMTVAMQVDAVPTKLDGTGAKIVIGQIHGGDHQLVRLYYENGSVYWVNGRNEVQAKDVTHQFRDAEGNTPQVSLDETFRYSFELQGDDLSLSLRADGTTYTSSITIGAGWDDNLFYFKAGLYLGTNETTSRGSGQVSIYDLDLGHDRPQAEPDVPGGTGTVGGSMPPPAPVPTTSVALTGTNYADRLTGTAKAETINGRNSNDDIAGMGGNDTLLGGSGSDRFRMSAPDAGVAVIADWETKDQVLLDDATFQAVASGIRSGNFVIGTAARDADDHLIHDPATGALFYDADGAGAARAVQFAEIENGATLTFADFGLF